MLRFSDKVPYSVIKTFDEISHTPYPLSDWNCNSLLTIFQNAFSVRNEISGSFDMGIQLKCLAGPHKTRVKILGLAAKIFLGPSLDAFIDATILKKIPFETVANNLHHVAKLIQSQDQKNPEEIEQLFYLLDRLGEKDSVVSWLCRFSFPQSKNLLESILKRHSESIYSAFKLLCPTYIEDYSDLIENPEEFLDLLQLSFPLLKLERTQKKRYSILVELRDLPSYKRKEIVTVCMEFFPKIGENKSSLIRKFAEFRCLETRPVLESVKPLLNKSSDGREIASIIDVLDSVKKEEQQVIVQLIKNANIQTTRHTCIQTLISIPASKRENVFDLIQKNCKVSAHSTGLSSLLNTLGFIQGEDIQQLFDQIFSHFPNLPRHKLTLISHLLSRVSMIVVDKRKDFLDFCNDLFPLLKSYENIYTLLEHLYTLKQHDERAVDFFLQLYNIEKSSQLIVHALRTLFIYPKDKRLSILNAVADFSKKSKLTSFSSLIDFFGSGDVEECQEILRFLAKKLPLRLFEMLNFTYFLQIPKNDRILFLESFYQLSKVLTYSLELQKILEIVAHHQDRVQLCWLTSRLISSKRQKEIHAILTAIIAIPSEQRVRSIDQILPIIDEEIDSSDCVLLISKMINTPKIERTELVELLTCILHPGSTKNREIINAVSVISIDQLRTTIWRAKSLQKDSFKTTSLSTIVLKILDIAPEKLIETLQSAEELLEKFPTITFPEGLFDFANVYVNERQYFEPFLKKINYLNIKITHTNLLTALFQQLKLVPFEHLRRAHLAAQDLIKNLSIHNQMKCLALIARFKAERLPQLISDMAYLTKECENADSSFEIMETYLGSENKTNIQNRLQNLSPGVAYNRPEVIKRLLYIPVKDWIEVYPICQTLLQQCPDINSKIKIFNTVIHLFPKQRANIVEQVVHLKINVDDLPEIMLALQTVPNVLRQQLMNDASILFGDIRETHWPALIEAFNRVEPNERKQLILDYYQNFKDVPERDVANCLEKLSMISHKMRQALYKFLENSFSHFSSDSIRLEVIMNLSMVRSTEWQRCLSFVKELLPHTHEISPLFTLLYHQSESDLSFALLCVRRYCRKMQESGDQVQFIEECLSIEPATREPLLVKMHQLDCCLTFPSLKRRIQCLEILKETPPEILEEILSSDLWLNRHLYINQLFHLVALLASFPIKDIKSVLDIALTTIRLLKGKHEDLLKTLLHVLKSLPHSERHPFANTLLSIGQGVKVDNFHFAKLCAKLKSFTPLFRSTFLPPIQKVLSRQTTFGERTAFIFDLEGANPDQLEETLELVSEKLSIPHEEAASVVTALSIIPSQDRLQLLSDAQQLVGSAGDTSLLLKMIKILHMVQQNERKMLIELISLFAKKDSNNFNPKFVLQCLVSIPVEERSKAVNVCVNYPFHPDIDVAQMLKIAHGIIKNNQLSLFEDIKRVVKKIKTTDGLIKSIPILLNIALEKREDLLDFVVSGAEEFHNIYPLVKIIYELRKENIRELMIQADPLLNRVENAIYVENVLKLLAKIPREERDCLVTKVMPLHLSLSGADQGKDLHQILDALHSIPKNEHDEIFELIAYPERKNHELAAQLITTIIHHEQHRRKKIVDAVAPFRKDLSIQDYVQLMGACGDFTDEELEQGLDNLFQPLFHFVDNPQTQSRLIMNLGIYPPSERKEAIACLQSIIHLMGEGNEQKVALNLLIIPPAFRKEVSDLWRRKKRLSPHDLSTVLHEREELRLISHHYLRNLLEQSIMNKRISFTLAEMVINHFHDLQLHDEHPLFQQAIERMAMHGSKEERTDPYRLYDYLKRLLAKENMARVVPQVFPFEGKFLAINLEQWRHEVNRKPLVLGDLPKNLPPGHFVDLFESFNKRLNQLPEGERRTTQKYIERCFAAQSNKLQDDFLEKQFIRGLFQITGSPDTVIDNVVFYIHVILKYICDQDNTLSRGKLISDREETLFRVSCSINECPTGQRDGVVCYYNNLPLAYRARSEMEKMAPEAKVSEIVKRSVQGLLHQTFRDIELLKLLEPTANLSQYPHKTLFFMNRLHRQVGLEHRLTFDGNANVLPEFLLDISVEDLLKAFFKLCTPMQLAQKLQKEVESALADKSIKYMDLMYTMEHMRLSLNEAFILNKNDFPVGITQEGALAILLYNKALKLA